MDRSAYLDGLRMLARRELSEAQVRQRLIRRGHDRGEVDAAVARLVDERAIDDARAAESIARTAAALHRRGRLRVRRQIESAGIAADTARKAVDTVFSTIDDDSLIEAALSKRLRGPRRIESDTEYARLYRYLLGQGFEADRIARALDARRER